MIGREELEIEITPDGIVQVHVKGIGGERCLDYVEVFQNLLGPVTDQRLTEEYYQPNVIAQNQRIRNIAFPDEPRLPNPR